MRSSDYVTRWRPNIACGLSRDTDLPLAEIGLRVGYQGLPAFSRAFTAQVALRAAQWRQAPDIALPRKVLARRLLPETVVQLRAVKVLAGSTRHLPAVRLVNQGWRARGFLRSVRHDLACDRARAAKGVGDQADLFGTLQ